MRGVVWPVLKNAPLEHIVPNVPVVTTSISLAARAAPFLRTMAVISSAVTTTALPALILSLISSKLFVTCGLLSPRAASGGEVSFRDKLPVVVGLAVGFLLWSLIMTGASILLNSVMEEKSNKILEVLLSSASATEILAGKVLGHSAILAFATIIGYGAAAAALWLRGEVAGASLDAFVFMVLHLPRQEYDGAAEMVASKLKNKR